MVTSDWLLTTGVNRKVRASHERRSLAFVCSLWLHHMWILALRRSVLATQSSGCVSVDALFCALISFCCHQRVYCVVSFPKQCSTEKEREKEFFVLSLGSLPCHRSFLRSVVHIFRVIFVTLSRARTRVSGRSFIRPSWNSSDGNECEISYKKGKFVAIQFSLSSVYRIHSRHRRLRHATTFADSTRT